MPKPFVQASSRNPEYSVTVYPQEDFGRGDGWFMHLTKHPYEALSPDEVKAVAGESVVEELREIGNFVAWG